MQTISYLVIVNPFSGFAHKRMKSRFLQRPQKSKDKPNKKSKVNLFYYQTMKLVHKISKSLFILSIYHKSFTIATQKNSWTTVKTISADLEMSSPQKASESQLFF